MVHELLQMPRKVWLYNSLKSTMLILDNPVSIIIQNNFKYKKQIQSNSDIVSCEVALHDTGRGWVRKEIALLPLSLSGRWGMCRAIGSKLTNRLEVTFYQQEPDSSS